MDFKEFENIYFENKEKRRIKEVKKRTIIGVEKRRIKELEKKELEKKIDNTPLVSVIIDEMQKDPTSVLYVETYEQTAKRQGEGLKFLIMNLSFENDFRYEEIKKINKKSPKLRRLINKYKYTQQILQQLKDLI